MKVHRNLYYNNMQKGNYKQALAYTSCIFAILVLSTLSITHISSIISNTLTLNKVFAQTSLSSSSSSISSSGEKNSKGIPSAKSVFDTGTVSLPSSVKGFIISLPDETHEFDSSNRTISHQNAHYLPSNLVIPSAGVAVAFVHGDPNHIHVESVTDTSSTGKVFWQTIPVKHPGASDIKIFDTPGSYSISDIKYPSMKGTITVEGNAKKSSSTTADNNNNENLVVGGFFTPTSSLTKYKTDFTTAGFQVLSTYNFLSKTKQHDISGPTTLLIYSTTMPMQDALTKLVPLLGSLPYL
jgi:plastocyanin